MVDTIKVKGLNTDVELFDDKIVINKKGLTKGNNPHATIWLDLIDDVILSEATAMKNGFLYVREKDSRDREVSLLTAQNHLTAFVFKKKQMDDIVKLKEEIKRRIGSLPERSEEEKREIENRSISEKENEKEEQKKKNTKTAGIVVLVVVCLLAAVPAVLFIKFLSAFSGGDETTAKSSKEVIVVDAFDLIVTDMSNPVKASLKYENKIVKVNDAMTTGISMSGTSSAIVSLEDGRIMCVVRDRENLVVVSDAKRAASNIEGVFQNVSGQTIRLDPCRLLCQFPKCP